MRTAAFWLIAMACSTQQPGPALTIDGPNQLRVDKLGPVDGPAITLDDGARPDGVVIAVSDPAVASIQDGRLIAKAPGQTRVTATWGEQEVVWTLVVDPAVRLRFIDIPASIIVGETAAIAVEARIGTERAESGDATWASSDTAVATVDGGTVTGQAVGVSFITARIGTSEAMAEIEVVEPE